MDTLNTLHIKTDKKSNEVKITLYGDKPPLFILIVFSLFIVASFCIPFIVASFVLDEGFHIVLLFVFGLCWAFSAFMTKIMLWNFYGKEHYWLDDETIYYQADYNYFKGSIQSIDINGSQMGYIEQGDDKGQLHLINEDAEIQSSIKIPTTEINQLIELLKQEYTNNYSELVELLSNSLDDDFKDLIFRITSVSKVDENRINLVCMAQHNEKIVGFALTIHDNAKPGIIKGEIDNSSIIHNGASIHTLNSISNNFLETLAALYDQPKPKEFSQNKIEFTIFPLNENVATLANGKFKFKFFYDNNEDLYAELYINIDLPNKLLEFNEKDAGYRENIIRVLGNI